MSARVHHGVRHAAAAALRSLALALAVLVLGARGAAAQFLEFRPPPPAQATGSVPVTIAFGGAVGADGGCNNQTDPNAVACDGDPYYYPYDDAVPPSALQFTVNGVDRTATLSVSGPVDDNCWYGSYNSYQCTRTYTATGSAPLATGVTNALTAAASSYGLSQTAYVNTGAGSGVTGAGLGVALVSPRLYRDPAQCTLDCGELVKTITTAAYTSLNTPHAVSIMYRSGRAWPMPIVEVDVSAAPAGTAQIGLQLLNDAGAQVYIWGGGGERVRQYTTGAPNRLAVMFDAYSNTPSAGGQAADWARVYTAVVSAYDASGTLLAQQPLSARILVDWWNGRASQYGAGWGLVGAPQFRFTGGSVTDGLVIFDGSGEMGYWDAPTVSGSVYTYRSPPGDFSTVSFDASTNQLTRRWPDGSSATFAGNGFPAAVSNRLGYGQLTFTYANVSWGPVLRSITEGNGRGFTWLYRGEPGYPASEPALWRQQTPWQISDGLGRQTGFAVDTSNDLRGTQDADGTLSNTMLYYGGGSPHLLQQVTDRRGGTWRFAYDIWAKLSSVTSPPAVGSGGTQAVTTPIQTWALGVLYSADLNGNQGTLNHPAPPLLTSQVRASITDPAGHVTSYHQDAWGAPDLVQAPGGVQTSAARDANGNVTQTVDARGNVTSFVWDVARPFLLDSTYDAASRLGVAFTYDAANFYGLQQTRVGGQETEYRTYSGGRLASVRSGGTSQPATTYDYSYQADADLRPHSVTDPRGHVTTYAYAGYAPQNIVGITDASGTTSFGYDRYGNTSFIKDPLGDSTMAAYDAMNRPTQATDANGHTTTTDYDALYARTVTDAARQQYRDSVNALGLPFFSYDPGGHPTTTTYDAAGRVATWANRHGDTFTYTYDAALGYLSRRTVSDTALANSNNATYGADALGRVRWARNVEGTDSVFTDSLGRDTLAVHRIPALAGYRYLVQSQYDSLGRRTRAWYFSSQASNPYATLPSNQTTYVYGSAGELSDVNRGHLSYNNESVPTAITYEGNFTVSRYYTAQHTLAAQHFSTTAENVLAADFTYDPLSRVTARYAPAMTQRRSYAYDRAGQLAATWLGGLVNTTAQSCQPGSSPGAVPGDSATTVVCAGAYDSTNTVAYAWDAVGNPAAPGLSVTPNSGNQLTNTPQETLGYDADGNLVTRYSNSLGRTTAVYTWNSLNQLVAVGPSAAGPPSVTFGYDAWGRRVRKSSTVNGVTTTTYFVWDGDDLAADVDAGGNSVAMYSYYPGGMDQPFSVQVPASSGRRYYYVTEPPGHVTGLVDYSGTAVATYRYADPFGAGDGTAVWESSALSGWTNRLRFGAREYDAETGLYYVRARYYDPGLGRFLSPDPSGLAAGVNWYAYAGNDPVNHRDPTGLDAGCTGDTYWYTTATQGGVTVGPYPDGVTFGTCTPNSPIGWGTLIPQSGPISPPGLPGHSPPPAPPNQPIARPNACALAGKAAAWVSAALGAQNHGSIILPPGAIPLPGPAGSNVSAVAPLPVALHAARTTGGMLVGFRGDVFVRGVPWNSVLSNVPGIVRSYLAAVSPHFTEAGANLSTGAFSAKGDVILPFSAGGNFCSGQAALSVGPFTFNTTF